MGSSLASIQNMFMFPAPTPSYKAGQLNKWAQDATELKMHYSQGIEAHYVPVLFLASLKSKAILSSRCLLYFHGNAEDLGQSIDILNSMRKYLGVNVLAVEYPAYGASTDTVKSTDVIKMLAVQAYHSLRNVGF